MNLSTGLRNLLIGTSGTAGFSGIFSTNSFMDLYTAIPLHADYHETSGGGVFIASITRDGQGTCLSFGTAGSGGILSKSSDVWRGTAASGGACPGQLAYYRMYGPGKVTGSSNTAVRFDGTIGVGTYIITPGSSVTIPTATFTILESS